MQAIKSAIESDRLDLLEEEINLGFDVNIIINEEGDTLLMTAVKADNQRIVEFLILNGADVNKPDSNGVTPLMESMSSRNSKIAQILILNGADTNATDVYGNTALMNAVDSGNGELRKIQLLIDHGADINATQEDGRTALYYAIAGNDRLTITSVVKLLLDLGADPNIPDEDENTVLFLATQRHLNEVIKLLVNAGANIEHKNYIDQTVLMIACRDGYFYAVKYFIQKLNERVGSKDGAFMLINNARDNEENTAITLAVISGRLDIVKYLIKYGSMLFDSLEVAIKNKKWQIFEYLLEVSKRERYYIDHLLSQLIQYDQIDIIKKLIPRVSNINYKDEWGNTALMFASFKGQIEIVKLLVDSGADINIQNNEGNTALYLASKYNHYEVVQYLIEMGANGNVPNIFGVTAYKISKVKGNQDIIELLSKQQTSFDNPLIQSVYERESGKVAALLDFGHDINVRGKGDATPLIVACDMGYFSTSDFLIREGANVNVQDYFGMSPLMYASMIDIKLVNLLINSNADISMVNKWGKSAKDIAKYLEKFDIVALLDFYEFILPIVTSAQSEIFDPITLGPSQRKKFIDFVSEWKTYCEGDKKFYPAYILFISKFLGLRTTGRTKEDLCRQIYEKLLMYLQTVSQLDYSLFNDTVDPVYREKFTEYPPFVLYQYGEPIEDKYRGIEGSYIEQNLDKTNIEDPIDRSELSSKMSNQTNQPILKDFIIRKMIPEEDVQRSAASIKPVQEMDLEYAPVETLADKLRRFDSPQLIEFINRLNPNRMQRLPTQLSKDFYISMLMRNSNKFNEIPELRDLLD